MSKTIVNLTIPLVVEEVERVLETYPHHPHQQAFANPDLRQALIAYVLSCHCSQYVAVDEAQEEEYFNSLSMHSLEHSDRLETTIHNGIADILRNHTEDIEHQIPEEIEAADAPSHWFG